MVYDETTGTIQPSPVLTVSEVLGAVAAYDAITGILGPSSLLTVSGELGAIAAYDLTTGILGPSSVVLDQLFTRQVQTIRVDCGVIASATPSLVIPVLWPVAFADNNYTLTGSVVILETPPAAAATEIICIGSIELAVNGTGFSFVVCNASSGVHHVIANFFAIHD